MSTLDVPGHVPADGAANSGRRRSTTLAVVALAVWATLWVVRSLLPAGDGLLARYYENPGFADPVAFTAVDAHPSTETLHRRWEGTPKYASARWTGYLVIGSAATYHFVLTTDGHARLSLDNQLVVDRAGDRDASPSGGVVQLAAGPHFVVLDHSQQGGGNVLEWRWLRAGGELRELPTWSLSQRRVPYSMAVVARGLDWAWWLALAAVVLTGARAARGSGLDRRLLDVVRRRPAIPLLVLFVALAVAATWPLVTDIGHLSRNDNGDAVLNEWIIAWVAHQAPRHPLDLFQANIFHPEAGTLAYSEALLVQSAIAAPFLWLGASPVLASNLVVLSGFALTGWVMCLVVGRWTRDWSAGIAAGIVIAFNAHTESRIPHLQALHAEFLPLILVALDRLLQAPRIRHSLSLAGAFVLQALCSYYLLVMVSLGLVAATLARPATWWGRRGLAVAKALAVAAGLAVLLLLPYLWPYWSLSRAGLNRGLVDLVCATPRNYLTAVSHVDYWLLEAFYGNDALFPGFVALGLAVVALARGAWKDDRVRMCLAFGACGVVLSFGSSVPGFGWLWSAFPPLHGIRAIVRFGYLGLVTVAVLGGFGVAAIRQWVRRPSWALVCGLCLPALVFAESLAAPIEYTYAERILPIYHRLDGVPGAVVADLPLAPHARIFQNAPAMLDSTTSFYRLINGYSGFIPASYYEVSDAVETFPAPDALAALRRRGVTHLFVHTDQFAPGLSERLDREPSLQRLAAEQDVLLYAFTR